MSDLDETVADYAGLHVTTGPHLMAYLRPDLDRRGVVPVGRLGQCRDGEVVRTAGAVIVRQRPGTARGFVFLTIEDESGMAQAIIEPDLYQQHRPFLVRQAVLLIEGAVQKRDGTLSVKARRFEALEADASVSSHDFH